MEPRRNCHSHGMWSAGSATGELLTFLCTLWIVSQLIVFYVMIWLYAPMQQGFEIWRFHDMLWLSWLRYEGQYSPTGAWHDSANAASMQWMQGNWWEDQWEGSLLRLQRREGCPWEESAGGCSWERNAKWPEDFLPRRGRRSCMFIFCSPLSLSPFSQTYPFELDYQNMFV